MPDAGIATLLLSISAETSKIRSRFYPDVPSGLSVKPWVMPLVIMKSEELIKELAISKKKESESESLPFLYYLPNCNVEALSEPHTIFPYS